MSYLDSDPFPARPVFRFRRMAAKPLPKRLLSEFHEAPVSEDAIKVFLRLKPNTDEQSETIMEVLDSRTLLFKTPSELVQTRKKLNIPDQYKYTFSRIFESSVSQENIFKGCVVQHVKDLFAGRHCLLFTYGTTNAGKTYTILGNGEHPGIIPRTLTTIFKSIGDKKYQNARIMPQMFNSALDVTDTTFAEEMAFKNRILKWNPDRTQADTGHSKVQNTLSTNSSIDDLLDEPVFKQMQNRLTGEMMEVEYEAGPDDRFSVWVSFAEIYNEAIYDLLQPVTLNSRRTQLKISRDKDKNCFIKGLKHVCVENEEEAYKVLRFGKTNLQVAATGINSNSSRSHCIFSIKLMKCPNVPHPERVAVSSFSICDLAGAERQKKTHNDGLRLKESQNINCSLMVLSKCFSIIRENQLTNDQKLVPFRESKLTQLFQHALLGKESVTMIVNVNVEQYLFEETQHVLKASAIAKHIVVQHRPANQRNRRVTRHSSFAKFVIKNKSNRSTMLRWDSCAGNANASDAPSLETIIDDLPSEPTEKEKKEKELEDLLVLVDSLKEKLKQEKTNALKNKQMWMKREESIRNEMRAELDEMMLKAKKQNEQDQARVHTVIDGNKEMFRPVEGDTNDHTSVKRRKISPSKASADDFTISDVKDLQYINKVQQTELDGLSKLISMFQEEKKQLTMDLTYEKMRVGFKETEIESLKQKIDLFGHESDLKAAYLRLEKEMAEKISHRDYLLEEARNELLEELSQTDDLQEEILKLQKEIENKDETIKRLIVERQDLHEELSAKTGTLDLLGDNIDEIQSELDETIKKHESDRIGMENKFAEKEKVYQEAIENLRIAKSVADEKLTKLLEDFEMVKQELEDKIENYKIRDEVAIDYEREEFRKELEEEYDERIVQIIINMTEDNELRISDLYRGLESKNIATNKQISELHEKLSEGNKMRMELQQMLESAQKQITESSKKILELEKYLESQNEKPDKQNQEYLSEISSLDQHVKQLQKEGQRLGSIIEEKDINIEKLNQELQLLRSEIDSINSDLKSKERDLDCCKSQLQAYQSSVPALESNWKCQQREKSEYRAKCDNLTRALHNMEKELESFQNNQKEIIGKYEDQLKKTKDENETLKNEVANLTRTFFKTTPTPKKDLEIQIAELKKMIDQQNAGSKQSDIKEGARGGFADEPEQNKENDCAFETLAVPVSQDCLKDCQKRVMQGLSARLRCQSSEEPTHTYPDESHCSRSASKLRPRTRATTNVLREGTKQNAELSSQKDEESKPVPKQSRRKQLWYPANDGAIPLGEGEVEFGMNDEQDSPGTIVVRTLRTRQK